MRQRYRDQHGGVSSEWVAVVVVVAALIAALWAAGVANRVGTWAVYAACTLFSDGEGCEHPDAGLAGDPDGPLPPPVSMTCLDASTRETAGAHVTLFSVRVNGDLAYQIDRLSNGEYEVTLELSGGLAAEVMAGGRLSASELGVREGRSGSVTAGVGGTVAPSFRFDSEQEAVAFAESARDLVAGPIRDTLSPRNLLNIGNPGMIIGRVVFRQGQRVWNFDPPAPSGLKIEGGVEVSAEGLLYGRGAGIEGALSAGTTLGAEIDFDTGETTLYVAVDASVAADIGFGQIVTPVGGGVGAGGELEGEVVLALTVDRDHRPVELSVGATVVGAASAHGFAASELFSGGAWAGLGQDLSHAISSGGLRMSDADMFSLSAVATLDLTDPATQGVGMDLLGAVASQNRAAQIRAGSRFVRHAIDTSNVEVQLHTGDRSSFDLEAKGGKGLTFGGGITYGSQDVTLAGAWARPPGGSFVAAHCN